MKKVGKNDVPTGLQIVELMKDFVKVLVWNFLLNHMHFDPQKNPNLIFHRGSCPWGQWLHRLLNGCTVSCEIVGKIVVGEEITSSFVGERPVLRGADCVEDDGDVRGEVTTVTGVIQVVDDAAAIERSNQRRIKAQWLIRLGECSGGRARRLVRIWEMTEKTLSMVVCLAEANGSIGLHKVLGDWLTQPTYGRNSPRPSLGNEPYLADRDHEAEC
ncbi:hypothetical protein YC2023_098495 [Brassica napus]